MSNKIWRGKEAIPRITVYGGQSRTALKNCTVVPDSACFPVREALRLCKTATEFATRASNPNCLYPGYGGLNDAVDAYIRAVARMKAKKGRK
jgi:hypothetical protein